jgi:hypothetical protein
MASGSPARTENPCRQKEQGANEGEKGFDGDPDQPKRERDQPKDGKQDQKQQRQGPAQDAKQAKANQQEEQFHTAAILFEIDGSQERAVCRFH